jgi:uracil-DNA glycosylase family 4
MKKIENDIQNCLLCGNLTKLNCKTISYGTNTDFLFIGESPAKNGWLLTGRAFYDSNNKLLPTGKVLDRLLTILNLTIDDITFTEACKCYIPDRHLLKQSTINCLSFLKRQIIELQSKILIPLGEHPTRILLSDITFKNFNEVVGRKYVINILGEDKIVIPIYHPSPINPKGYKDNVVIFEKIKETYEEMKCLK